MAKIPFKISARTARLIGRQNFSNADGAIIELIKNCYDADASTCIVFFDNKYAVLPERLSEKEYDEFHKECILLPKYYQPNLKRNDYVFVKLLTKIESEKAQVTQELQNMKAFFLSKCKILIIDNGEGMTDQIIENFWMTIGTDNKEENIFTHEGRVKTGAKGIGRFALDRLGDVAEMLTKPDSEKHSIQTKHEAYLWHVDWRTFDGNAKTLDEVEADLIEGEVSSFSQQITSTLPFDLSETLELDVTSFRTGTQIEIKDLRDEWDDYAVNKLFTNLEVLIPPREERVFDIFVFSTLNPKSYGQVAPSICDDYDYKIHAIAHTNGQVDITIYRNEVDLPKVPYAFFEREKMQVQDYTQKTFEDGKIVIRRQISELVPGLADIDEGSILGNIGKFECTFYFMKRSQGKNDRERFISKEFNDAARKRWFDLFGGIKLFRDNFRVRPYGEIGSPSFDWLELAKRAGSSPAGIAKSIGRWRVRPNQITGVINISRLTNIEFEDQSNRQGIQENRFFTYFIQLIGGIINEFERDRQYIARELRTFYGETHLEEDTVGKAQVVKKRIREREKQLELSKQQSLEIADSVLLLNYNEILEDRIETLNDEVKLLGILASSGLIIASFTHELSNIKDNLVYRIDKVEKSLQSLVDIKKLQDLPRFLNPLTMLHNIKHEDIKLKEWLHYSLETLRRDDKENRAATSLMARC